MVKKNIHKKTSFRGRDAVIITAIWIGVYLTMMYFLAEAVTSSDLISMFVGLVVALIVSVLLKNGW